jgi:hypothetical protein
MARSGGDLIERARLWTVAAVVARADERVGDAVALYEKALPSLETLYGSGGAAVADARRELAAARAVLKKSK